MTDEKKPPRKILADLPDGRKIYIDRARRRAVGFTIGIGADDPALDELVNLPDADDGEEN